MNASTTTNTAGRDFALAEFFLGLAAVAHIAVAALAICAKGGLDVIPTLIITAAAVAAGLVAYILVLGRK